jgi:hypothetical protein
MLSLAGISAFSLATSKVPNAKFSALSVLRRLASLALKINLRSRFVYIGNRALSGFPLFPSSSVNPAFILTIDYICIHFTLSSLET